MNKIIISLICINFIFIGCMHERAQDYGFSNVRKLYHEVQLVEPYTFVAKEKNGTIH